MRKVLGIAVGLAAMTLAGCQFFQQPKQESAPQSVLDVRPVRQTQDPAIHSTASRFPLPVQAAVPPDEPSVAIAAEPSVTVTPSIRSSRKAQDAPLRVAGRKPSAPRPGDAGDQANYKVKRGDTLYGIARTEYGDGKKWTVIASANPGLSPQSLKTGQTIVIP